MDIQPRPRRNEGVMGTDKGSDFQGDRVRAGANENQNGEPTDLTGASRERRAFCRFFKPVVVEPRGQSGLRQNHYVLGIVSGRTGQIA